MRTTKGKDMENGAIDFRTANAEVIKEYADQAGKFSDASFFNFEKDTETSFFILPPWGETGLLAREIWACYMPNKKRWNAWRTWNHLNSEFGASDPVVAYLEWLKLQPGVDDSEVKNHNPKVRYYCNAIVTGVRKGGQYQPFQNMKDPQILNMPSTVWNEICAFMQKPGFDVPYDPNRAILFIASRTGSGLSTEYKVTFAGTRGATGEEVPNRYNLAAPELLGSVDGVKEALSNPNDLDKRWSPPKGNDSNLLARAEEIKALLKAKFLTTGVDPSSIGAAAGPGGGLSVGGQTQTAPQTAPPFQASPPVADAGAAGGVAAPSFDPTATVSAPSQNEASAAFDPSAAAAPTGVPSELQTDIPTPDLPDAPPISTIG